MSSRPLRRALCAAVIALGMLPAAASAADPGVSTLGVNPNEPAWAAEALSAAPTDRKWVYMPMSWGLLQPEQGVAVDQGTGAGLYDDLVKRVDAYRAAGIRVVGLLTTAPTWAHGGETIDYPPDDAHMGDFVAFTRFMAERFAGKISHWQIWNEANQGHFWRPGPQPDRYARMLKDAYTALKGVDPGNTVITTGLVHNDYDFVEQLYRHGAGNHFDAVGIHLGTKCLTREPNFYERDMKTGRIGKYYFTGYREVRQQMRMHGQEKPIFLEIGWSTSHDKPCDKAAGDTSPAGVTEAKQAQFLTQSFECLANDPYVAAAGWFSMVDAHREFHGFDSTMGLIDFGGRFRPSFHAMKAVAAGVQKKPCGGVVDTDKPTVSIDVASSYFTRLVIKGAAADPTTPVRKIELWVDGERVEGLNQDRDTYELDWFGSTKLPYGKHTIELRAYDEALNMASAAKEVTRVNPATAARSVKPALTFKAKRRKGKKVKVYANLRPATEGDFREQPKGRMRIIFARKKGKKYRPYSKYTKGISKPVSFTWKARKPGRWKVWVKLQVDAPYKNLRSKTYKFKF